MTDLEKFKMLSDYCSSLGECFENYVFYEKSDTDPFGFICYMDEHSVDDCFKKFEKEKIRMTKIQKIKFFDDFCDDHRPCDKNCTFYNHLHQACSICDLPIDERIKQVQAYQNCPESKDDDKVNHPNHYNREGAMECIDEMVLVFGKEAVMHFCICNAWKYRYRASEKGGEEDLKKSDFYLKKYKELLED